MIAKIAYFLISVAISGLYRGICARKGINVRDNILGVDVMTVVIIASVFVTINVVHFLISELFHS